MDKNNILIAVRPKTNSSYTAKKATVLSKLDLHFIDYVPHVGPDDNLSEWKVVTRQDLQDIEDAVYKQILKELEGTPNTQLLKEATSVGSALDIVSAYVWSMRVVQSEKDIIQRIADMIVACNTIALARKMYELNSNIELIIKQDTEH